MIGLRMMLVSGAKTEDFKLFGWGLNDYNQLGLNDLVNRTSPVQIGSDTDWEMVSVGNAFSLAIKNNKLHSWGYNGDGRTGLGTTVGNTTTPTQVGSDTDWEIVSVGYDHSFGIKSGKLYAWGQNTYGQLGDGTTIQRESPVQIGSDTDWKQVSAYNHSLGIKG